VKGTFSFLQRHRFHRFVGTLECPESARFVRDAGKPPQLELIHPAKGKWRRFTCNAIVKDEYRRGVYGVRWLPLEVEIPPATLKGKL
jgi:hypothetical protein